MPDALLRTAATMRSARPVPPEKAAVPRPISAAVRCPRTQARPFRGDRHGRGGGTDRRTDPRPPQGSMVTHPGAYRLRTNRTDRGEAALWRPTSLRPISKGSSVPRIRTRSAFHLPPLARPGRGPPVRHRHRPPARAGDPRPPAYGRPPRRLGRPSPDPRRATRYRHLPARRWTHLACAQGDTARSARFPTTTSPRHPLHEECRWILRESSAAGRNIRRPRLPAGPIR